MDEYCRLCGSEQGIKVNIFESDKEHVKKIHKILPITVNEHDSLPKSMCHRCSFKVNDFYEFRITCIRSQEMFKSKLPWMKNRTDLVFNTDVGQPPMVELPLNSINFISPSERRISEEPAFIDENDSMIIIDDDSPPCSESKSLQNNSNHQEKIIMKIKRSELKRRSRPKSVWDSKKRRKRTYNACRITEVFTTTVDDYDMIGDIENDPLSISPEETNQTKNNNQIVLDVNNEMEEDTVEEHVSTKNSGDSIQLPNYILVTNIPRVGSVYTCKNCGRTFLSPQPASLHTCHVFRDSPENIKPKDEDRDTSSNSATDFYSCNECNQLFSRQSQLIAHKKKHFEVISSSDEKAAPANRRRKRRRKSTVKSLMYKTDSGLSNGNQIDTERKTFQIETGIVRHSLLSSESDSD